MPVPRIIHQTWSDESPPERLASFQRAWRRLHPGWTYRLWTDAETRAFVAERYPWFLPTYDSYRSPIMRVDAARYLWMAHFGGVYADLDMEPVQSLDRLLGRCAHGEDRLLVAREPASHCRLHGRSVILSNAFLACAPGHPAWREVLIELVKRSAWPDPLSATGPFLLTDLYLSSPRFARALTLLDPVVVSPLDKFDAWASAQVRMGEDRAKEPRRFLSPETVAIHHWMGSWWRQPQVAPQRRDRPRVTGGRDHRRTPTSSSSRASRSPSQFEAATRACRRHVGTLQVPTMGVSGWMPRDDSDLGPYDGPD
jgi:hypothetical protein